MGGGEKKDKKREWLWAENAGQATKVLYEAKQTCCVSGRGSVLPISPQWNVKMILNEVIKNYPLLRTQQGIISENTNKLETRV